MSFVPYNGMSRYSLNICSMKFHVFVYRDKKKRRRRTPESYSDLSNNYLSIWEVGRVNWNFPTAFKAGKRVSTALFFLDGQESELPC